MQITHQLPSNITLLNDKLHMQTVYAHMTAALNHVNKVLRFICYCAWVLLLKGKNRFCHLYFFLRAFFAELISRCLWFCYQSLDRQIHRLYFTLFFQIRITKTHQKDYLSMLFSFNLHTRGDLDCNQIFLWIFQLVMMIHPQSEISALCSSLTLLASCTGFNI